MEKGQIFEITIEDMSLEGQGIGRTHEGLVVFVPGTVPGDTAKIQLTKVKKNYAFSRLVEMMEKSKDRTDECCPYSQGGLVRKLTGREDSRPCGGCPLGGMKYEAQLRLKEKQVRNKLERLAGVDFACAVLRPIIGMDDGECFRYRNKAVMPISTGGLMTRKGGIQEPVHEPRIGFLPARSNDVIDCEDCWLQAPSVMAAAGATRRFMLEDNITSYDERWDKGLMKGMTVKTAFGTGEVMVVYEINGKGIPNAAKLAEMLDDAMYEAGTELSGDEENPALSLESIVLKTVKNGRTRVETLIGKNAITDIVEFDGMGESDSGRALEFEISAESFYQVNPVQMRKLYGEVRRFVQASCAESSDAAAGEKRSKPVILDLYCGIGTIGLSVADLADHVYGIEVIKDAVIDANRNATINGIVNATYTCGKAEELIPKWFDGGDKTPGSIAFADVAILDPPRAGCRPELLQAIAKAEIPDIIYVSCDPATLARDIRLLSEGFDAGCRYELAEAVPVDMFPHTGHVETVCLLNNRKPDTKVRIDLDMEDYYRIKDEKKSQN